MQNSEWDANLLGGSIDRGITNPALIEERAKCTFDQAEFEKLMMGDLTHKYFTLRKVELDKHPELRASPGFGEMTREEMIEDWWRRYMVWNSIESPLHEKDSILEQLPFSNIFSRIVGVGTLDLHMSMFTNCMAMFTTEEQKKKWLQKTLNNNIIGCYAQTEIGHGSNVNALETTATFDLEKDEWIIHTPTIRATKFWPGSLGISATHAVIFARLITKGKDYGVQSFIVPIRSLETHKPFPGVEVGEIGVKLGYNAMDNGYLSFN